MAGSYLAVSAASKLAILSPTVLSARRYMYVPPGAAVIIDSSGAAFPSKCHDLPSTPSMVGCIRRECICGTPRAHAQRPSTTSHACAEGSLVCDGHGHAGVRREAPSSRAPAADSSIPAAPSGRVAKGAPVAWLPARFAAGRSTKLKRVDADVRIDEIGCSYIRITRT